MKNRARLRFYDFFVGHLHLDTPIHIGCSRVATETDAPLLRDAAGRFYLPGTSIAGPLKARAEELFKNEPDLIGRIFGIQAGHQGTMSRLLVEDALCATSMPTTIRDGVGIDRRWESASPTAKYDMEITPAGMKLRLTMRLDLRDGDDMEKMRFVVYTVLEDFRKGRIRLGAAKTRGLGRCRFEHTWRFLDFDDRSKLVEYLLARDTARLPVFKSEEIRKPDSLRMETMEELAIAIDLSVQDSPLLIKDGRPDGQYDAVFTRVFKDDDGTAKEVEYIPGSSLKGVFRARAEKILRTLGAEPCLTFGENTCSAGIKARMKAGDRIGTKKQACGKEEDEKRAREIRESSCPVCRLFGNGYLAGRIAFDDAFFGGEPGVKVQNNVAIDRFTGGAAEGKLFDACPVVRGVIKVAIRIRKPSNLEKALLLFLLRDLQCGFPPLRFGYGKTKGYGLLECDRITINGKEIGKDGVTLSNILEPKPAFERWWCKEAAHEQ